MTGYRHLALAVGVLVVLGAVAGTGGFSVVGADRSIEAAVVDDRNAYLGIVTLAKGERKDTDRFEMLYLINQFPGRLTDVTVTVADGADTTVTPYAKQRLLPLDPGENTVVGATCDEPTGGWVTLPLQITASGPEFRVTKRLDVEVKCKKPTPTPNGDTEADDDTNDEDDGDGGDDDSDGNEPDD